MSETCDVVNIDTCTHVITMDTDIFFIILQIFISLSIVAGELNPFCYQQNMNSNGKLCKLCKKTEQSNYVTSFMKSANINSGLLPK